MDLEFLLSYCLEKVGAYEDRPFGDDPICCKVGECIFAQFYADGRMMFKCDAQQAAQERETYPQAVCMEEGAQWAHWNTVLWNEIPQETLLSMLDRSYDRVFSSLPESVREEILHPQPEEEVKRRKLWRKK